ncbi:hypothetical protein ACFLSA_07220 [Bacteroidota bacterium]
MKRLTTAILMFLITILLINQTYGQPYPKSQVIKKLEWDEDVHRITSGTGDNWPITWINDTLQITSYGDGDGFDEENPDLSLGF